MRRPLSPLLFVLSAALVFSAVTFAVAASTVAASTISFSSQRALSHVKALCANGSRIEGSKAERQAFDYISARLSAYGYKVTRQSVRLPGGRKSANIIAEKRGSSPRVIVLGAHVDSRRPSPGANDNASGCAVLLELARISRDETLTPTLRFVFFGAEEMSDSNADHHHYGSRQYVASLTSAQRRRISGMVSADMLGYGSTFTVRSMKVAPQTVVTSLKSAASRRGVTVKFLRDAGRYGWSDHEAFERAGIPAAWLEWRYDSTIHTTADKPGRISEKRLATSGKLMESWLESMTERQLTALRP